jgi:hypothetical protein
MVVGELRKSDLMDTRFTCLYLQLVFNWVFDNPRQLIHLPLIEGATVQKEYESADETPNWDILDDDHIEVINFSDGSAPYFNNGHAVMLVEAVIDLQPPTEHFQVTTGSLS